MVGHDSGSVDVDGPDSVGHGPTSPGAGSSTRPVGAASAEPDAHAVHPEPSTETGSTTSDLPRAAAEPVASVGADGEGSVAPPVAETAATPHPGATPSGGDQIDIAGALSTAPTPTAPSAQSAAAPAASPPQAAGAPVDPAQLGNHLGGRLTRRGDSENLTVHLHPAELGAVRVDARTVDGVTNIVLTPSTDVGADRLGAVLRELRHDLARAGVELGDLDLQRGSGDGENSSRERTSPRRTGTRGTGRLVAAGDTATIPSRAADGRWTIDL